MAGHVQPAQSAILRAARTKRSRTRTQILEAFEQLIGSRDYDDIRVADIATLAGVGQATIYNTFGNKGSIVAAQFAALTESLDARVLGQVTNTANVDNGPLPDYETVLREYLERFGALWSDPPNRRTGRAFLRAYGQECLGLNNPSPEIEACLGTAQSLVNALLEARPTAYPALSLDHAGRKWTIFILQTALDEPPDRVRSSTMAVIQGLLLGWGNSV